MCLSIMRWLYVLATLKQHLSKISTSIHETVEQDWGWVEKKNVALKWSVYIIVDGTTYRTPIAISPQ